MHDLVSVYTQGTCTTVAGGSGGSFPYCTGAAGGGAEMLYDYATSFIGI